MNQNNIRNFAIIAHIDHGKSTLADRLLELTGTVSRREMQEQILDSNPIERERGITIKLAPVRMIYKDADDSPYILNLIDTPGHVDFSYEVSRSLAACEGAILVVDATQGVQAQTLANLAQARAHNLAIIPLINKIDLPNARIAETLEELKSLGFSKEQVIPISAKLGTNVSEVLKAIIERIPAPTGQINAPLRGLIFSSQYDVHKGVVVFVRIVDGSIGFDKDSKAAEVARKNLTTDAVHGSLFAAHPSVPKSFPPSVIPEKEMTGLEKDRRAASSQTNNNYSSSPKLNTKLLFLASGAQVAPIEVGYFTPQETPSKGIKTGEVGYIATGLKDIRFAKVGDTIALSGNKKTEPLPGYQEPKSMVFLGLFPLNSNQLAEAREAMERLRLSDNAFTFRPISSTALGHGFHCGFLGLLHAEIVQERLSREFNLNMIATAPSVEYLIKLQHGVIPAKAGIPSSAVIPAFEPESILEEDGSRVPPFRRAGKPGMTDNRQWIRIQSASEYPDPSLIEEVREPVMKVMIFSPKRYVGAVMQLAQEKRGEYVDLKYLGAESGNDMTFEGQARLPAPDDAAFGGQAEFTYFLPLSEMIINFFDRLKSITEGYASLDYEFFDYQPVEVVKLDIIVNKEKVDALSLLIVKDQAERRGREIVERLAEIIPRVQFAIPVQAALGGQVIARADVKPFRKDVIQKLYGGDRTRKDKLLEAQKKGKEKMKMIGKVSIPQSVFFEVLKRS